MFNFFALIISKNLGEKNIMNKVEKREKDIKEKLNNIKNYNNINIQCYNSLDFLMKF